MKKIYFLVEDNEDLNLICDRLVEIMRLIKTDLEDLKEDDEPHQFIITPVWLTEEEFANLPEHE